MKIEIRNYDDSTDIIFVEYFVERENGKYNNLNLSYQINKTSVSSWTKNQILSKGVSVIYPTVIQVFNRVWECKADEDAESWAIAPSAELLNAVGFEIVEFPSDPVIPQPKTQEEINRELMVQNNLMELKIALLMDEMGVL